MTTDTPDPQLWSSLASSGLHFDRLLGIFNNGQRIACLCSSEKKVTEKNGESGTTDTKQQSIVVLEKLPISETEVSELLLGKIKDSASLIFTNDVYYTFTVMPNEDCSLNRMKATVVHPATEQHISKYSYSETVLITETPEFYDAVTKPYIKERQLGVRWVYNILDGKAEADRVIYVDSDPEAGFILLPDMKWDGTSDPARRLYLVAIVNRRDLFSLRNLNEQHLPLLEKIARVVPKVIKEKYSISQDKLRIFFHYLPSYWHLHIHFVVGTFSGEESGALGGLWSAERAHWLSSVIANIRLNSQFYQKTTLIYSLREDHPLRKQFLLFSEKLDDVETMCGEPCSKIQKK